MVPGRIVARLCGRCDFAPGFFIEHFIKDMSIALAEAERMRLDLPGLALAKKLLRAAQGTGLRPQRNPGFIQVLREVRAMAMDFSGEYGRGVHHTA